MTPGVVSVLVVALAAAAWTVVRAGDMAAGDMTAGHAVMGGGRVDFVVMWSVMMAAMMLPSMIPLASRYLRKLPCGSTRAMRGSMFVGGYLLVWSGTAVLALASSRGAAFLVNGAGLPPGVVNGAGLPPGVVASGVLTIGAVHALTPAKHRLLRQCRSPLGLVLQYASYRGVLRDLRAGLHHGLVCLGCCWSLMALMLVFGTMNVAAMVVLAVVVAIEKVWRHGAAFARAVGWAMAVLAIALMAAPDLADRVVSLSTSI